MLIRIALRFPVCQLHGIRSENFQLPFRKWSWLRQLAKVLRPVITENFNLWFKLRRLNVTFNKKKFDSNEALYKAAPTTTLAPPSLAPALFESRPRFEGARFTGPARRRPLRPRPRRPIYYDDYYEYDYQVDEDFPGNADAGTTSTSSETFNQVSKSYSISVYLISDSDKVNNMILEF